MDPFWLDIALEIVKAIVGVAIPALTVWLMFHGKRWNNDSKMRSLKNRIGQLSQASNNLQTWQGLTYEERIESLMEAARLEAMDYEVSISEVELRIMVERSLQSLRMLDNIGFQLQLKKELNRGKVTKE
jgi:uncharacterized membrane protein